MILNHCHVFPEGAVQAVMDHSASAVTGTLQELLEVMDELGAQQAVVFAPFFFQVSFEVNDWLIDAIAGNERFIGLVTLNPAAPGAGDRLRELMKRGLRGVKLHPPVMEFGIADPECEEFYQVAEELGAVLLFHTGVHGWELRKYVPMLVDEVAQTHPELHIIVEHMGGYAFFHQALAVLQNNRHTYAGLTGALCPPKVRGEADLYRMPEDRFRLVLDQVGSERMVFGADFPYYAASVLKAEVASVHQYCSDEQQVQRILGSNLRNMLRL